MSDMPSSFLPLNLKVDLHIHTMWGPEDKARSASLRPALSACGPRDVNPRGYTKCLEGCGILPAFSCSHESPELDPSHRNSSSLWGR